MPLVDFLEYMPDLPAFNNPGSTLMKNVRPGGGSYLPVPTLVNYSNALSATAAGFFAARDPVSGTVTNFAGDATKLYKMSSGVWTDVSKVGGYALGADEVWQFTQFGSKVLATAIDQRIQYFDLVGGSAFADLTAAGAQDAPLARYIDSVRDFLFVGNTVDSVDGNVPNRVRWAGIGSSVLWQVSSATQADFQDLDGKYGWVTQVVGGEYGVVFQERAITRFDYIGSPAIFQVNTVETNRGTSIPTSVIKLGNLIYFIATDGFAVFDGQKANPIGVNKVDKTFFADFDMAFSFKVSVAVDYDNNLIMWAYPGDGHDAAGNPNKIIFYNYSPNAKNRWSYAEFPVGDSSLSLGMIVNSFSEGYVMDPAAAANSLDTWQTNVQLVTPNLDTLPYSLDSRIWTGGDILISAFSINGALANFTGTPLTADLETAEVQLTPGQMSTVFQVRPVIDNSSSSATSTAITVQLGTRNNLKDAIVYGSAIPVDSIGNCNMRGNARFHRFRVNVSGGFTHAIGVDINDFKQSGIR